ncbi:MAG: M67 family metallopeptidase [Geitlerinemataceae cyanobacterium]
MILELYDQHLQQIRDRAEFAYPHECCGLLLGRSNEGEKILVEVWETENVWDEESDVKFQLDSDESNCDDRTSFTSERRYTISPETLLAAQRYARDRQLEIVGIYHSHPDHPAVPSECDRQWAWQHYSYTIASVMQGKTVDIQSWQLDDDRQFQPEEIRING